jgi:DNA polymerase
MNLRDLKDEWINCNRCELSKTRRSVVFGGGNPNADILVVGEGPGENEDNTGRPFVGIAGQILDQFLETVGLNREEDLYVTNVVGCRPILESVDDRTGEMRTDNRPPSKDERLACKPRLMEIIYQVDPLLIITIGKVPLQVLLGKAPTMASIRGRMQTFHMEGRYTEIRYAVLPMYHTAFLNRTHDIRKEGPWGKTMQDWVLACNVIDYLREGYYGTPRPNREELADVE